MFNSFSKMCIQSYFLIFEGTIITSISPVTNLEKAHFQPPLFLLSYVFFHICMSFLLISLSQSQSSLLLERSFPAQLMGSLAAGTADDIPHSAFRVDAEQKLPGLLHHQETEEQMLRCLFHWLLLRHFRLVKKCLEFHKIEHTLQTIHTGPHFPEN